MPSWGARSANSPREEVEPVRWPESDDHLADDAVVRLGAERGRVRRGQASVAEREERAVRHFVGILDLGALRLRRAMRLREEAQPSVDIEVPVAQLHRFAGERDDAFPVTALSVR